MKKFENRLNEKLKDFVDRDQPVEKRLMAAKGLIPLPPSELASVLIVFIHDENEEIRKEAEASLRELPREQMLNILSDNGTFPELLDYAARNFDKHIYAQTILLNRATLDATFAYLAENDTTLANLEIIVNNKQRILRSANIVEALSKNSHLSHSLMDDVLSFLSMHLEKTDESIKILSGFEQKDDDNETDDLSPDEFKGSFFDDVGISEELIEESDDVNRDENEDSEQETKRESVYNMIQKLGMAEKIKLALQGNLEVRRELVKDTNRVISSAVLKNPKISESEIVRISQSKVVGDDILRQISDNRKWVKLYQVKLSLVKNPKTPPHISMNYLRHLREVDLKSIMRDKNLPGVVSNGAKNIYKEITRSK